MSLCKEDLVFRILQRAYINILCFTLKPKFFLQSIQRNLGFQYSLQSCVLLIEDTSLSSMSVLYREDEIINYAYLSVKAVRLSLNSYGLQYR